MFVPVPSVDCLSLPGHLVSGAVHKANHRIIIIIILIIIIIIMMMMMMMMTMMMMIIIITKSKESTEPREWQLLKNHRDWCTWNYLEERKGLVWEVKSAWHFWKHSCQPSLILLISYEKCCVSKLQEAAETWLRIPQKIPEKSHHNDIKTFDSQRFQWTLISF